MCSVITFQFSSRWLINNDDRNAFGDLENNADADRIFDVRDSLGVSHVYISNPKLIPYFRKE